jgi:hypothetical protein
MTSDMTSVLYSAGLNYQMGNPVRSEIVAVRRDVSDLRKQNELLTEENMVYRKFIMKLLSERDDKQLFNEFTQEVSRLSQPAQQDTKGPQSREAGNATVQGAGFRR